ncbi:MAG: tRNA uridine-5-carboxymethylaminomethyl(34) synthesis GTPase MnmE [Clostridia bacterium]|nr:tRNA uridine-5-carboxymethylaminomethyl(34) synthesis GTPase MnmE [Clostridia bacterium]
MQQDTIYAPSSAIGGAIAIIRVSGSKTRSIAKGLLNRDITRSPSRLCRVQVMDGDRELDECMAVFFERPRTYTGEDMLELHCHGGLQTVRGVLARLGKTEARIAENGEFTKRAFLNGKMDLSAAEAVMDIINAEAESSLNSALEQHRGGLCRRVFEIQELLLDALSGIDAAIDYPDEAEAEAYSMLPRELDAAAGEIGRLLEGGRQGKVLREGARLAIIGKPNVGKSSLLNAILDEERAIVTQTAGTTRDIIEERISLKGFPVRLFDTAGIRPSEDEAEAIGIARAKDAASTAELILVVLDGSRPLDAFDAEVMRLTEGRRRLVVQNKADVSVAKLPHTDILVSAKTRDGIAELEERVLSLIRPTDSDATLITNERHICALEKALGCINAAKRAVELDCIATDLRSCLHHLGQITGTDVDARTLDKIFENFCVGK